MYTIKIYKSFNIPIKMSEDTEWMTKAIENLFSANFMTEEEYTCAQTHLEKGDFPKVQKLISDVNTRRITGGFHGIQFSN